MFFPFFSGLLSTANCWGYMGSWRSSMYQHVLSELDDASEHFRHQWMAMEFCVMEFGRKWHTKTYQIRELWTILDGLRRSLSPRLVKIHETDLVIIIRCFLWSKLAPLAQLPPISQLESHYEWRFYREDRHFITMFEYRRVPELNETIQ